VVDEVPLTLEHDMQSPVAETATFSGNSNHARLKVSIIAPSGAESDSHAATADGFTRPPLSAV